jgi:ABC-type multidrug transport system ATPase subunit
MDLIEEFTLAEQIDFHFRMKSIRSGVNKEDLINILYLENSRDKYISNFSSGMKQRLKLGLAFYSAIDVILLDEPGTNLDEQAFAWYLKEFAGLPAQTTVIVASNNKSEYPENAEIINIQMYKR